MHSAASLDFKKKTLKSVSAWQQDNISSTNDIVHFRIDALAYSLTQQIPES